MGSSITNGVSSVVSPISGIATGLTPQINSADSGQVQNLINQSVANSNQYNTTGQGLQNNSNQYTNQAGQNINNTQGNIDQAQIAINTANNAAVGGNVNNSLNYLQQQAAGTAPTAGTGMLQQGTDQAIQAGQAMANSGNASQMLSGQKNAMTNAATTQQQAANQASQLAANQQMAGSQAYANAAAQQAAQLGTNAQIQQGQTAAQQQQSALYAQLANQQMQGALGYGGLTNQALNSGLQGQSNIYNTQQGVYNTQGQLNAGTMGGLLNAGGAGISTLASSDYNLKDNIQYASGPQMGQTYMPNSTSYNLDIGGVDRPVSTQERKFDADNKKEAADKKKDTTNAFSHAFRTDYSSMGNVVPNTQRVESINQPLFSDERMKEHIQHNDSVPKKFLDGLSPVIYDYKVSDGMNGRTPGKHLGIIAQDVERAPMGKSLVIDTPKGKMLDLPSSVGALFALASDLNDRMSPIEKYFSKKMKKKGAK